jgi:prepilin-type N-terminal cleavage/methylation domain-containing protein
MSSHRAQTQAGFTLFEVLIALLLLAGVSLFLAHLVARSYLIADRARCRAVMTTLAEERLEELTGLTWGLGEAAAPVAVSDSGTDLSGVAPASGGPGLSISAMDALARDDPGHVDYADRRGAWLAASNVPGAAFVRRWRVSPVPSATDCLAIEVLVDVVTSGLAPGAWPSPMAVRLTTVKARKAA